jgi:hypothetical protein
LEIPPQSPVTADFGIGQFVDRRLTEHPRFKACAGRESGRFIHPLQGLQQSPALFAVRDQLQLKRQVHSSGDHHSSTRETTGAYRAGNLFLCRLKATVSEVQIL